VPDRERLALVNSTSRNLYLDAAAVVIASRQGRIEYWSPGASHLFGYAVNQMVGGKITSIIPEQFRARHWTAWRRAWQTNEMPEASPIMIPVLCGDGAVRSFVSHLLPIRAPHGELLAVAAVWGPPSERDAGVRVLA